MKFKVFLLISIIFCSSLSFADNRSDQMNPNNDSYWESRGYDERPDDWEDRSNDYSNDELNNRSNQLNPNNDAYWQSRGYDERPNDSKSILDCQTKYESLQIFKLLMHWLSIR